jgi:hypothetical protein
MACRNIPAYPAERGHAIFFCFIISTFHHRSSLVLASIRGVLVGSRFVLNIIVDVV